MPIVRIVPHDAAGHCPLLENNKCVVHECKPVVCAMYPIGRTICIDTSVKNSKDMNVKDIEFLFTHPIRCGKTETHTVREWLTQFGIPMKFGKVSKTKDLNEYDDVRIVGKTFPHHENFKGRQRSFPGV